VGTTRQMKLQVELGNIQAGIDSSHSVLAHSCKCELALVGRSINGSSLGHRHERLRLPTHLVNSQCQRATNSSAPLSCRLQAAGQSHLPHPIFPDKDRWKTRYKRVGVRASVTLIFLPVLKRLPVFCTALEIMLRFTPFYGAAL
jgi:hypothetical protein